MKRKDAEVDRGIMKIEHARKRVELLRQTAESKSHLGDKYGEDAPPYYRNYRSNTESAAFEALGPTSEDAAVRAIQSAAYESVAQLAEGFGLDPEATRARFSGEQVSIGLGQDFRKTELKERAESHARRGKIAETKNEANDCIEKFYRKARFIFEGLKIKMKLI